ncbi:hypothetical protein D3C71_1806160 [compost metagenome]
MRHRDARLQVTHIHTQLGRGVPRSHEGKLGLQQFRPDGGLGRSLLRTHNTRQGGQADGKYNRHSRRQYPLHAMRSDATPILAELNQKRHEAPPYYAPCHDAVTHCDRKG